MVATTGTLQIAENSETEETVQEGRRVIFYTATILRAQTQPDQGLHRSRRMDRETLDRQTTLAVETNPMEHPRGQDQEPGKQRNKRVCFGTKFQKKHRRQSLLHQDSTKTVTQ